MNLYLEKPINRDKTNGRKKKLRVFDGWSLGPDLCMRGSKNM